MSGGSPRCPTSVNLRRTIAGDTTSVFVSTLIIQVSTFAILSLSGLVLPAEDFAVLSLVVASAMLANAFVDLGLNITMTKIYGDTGDEAVLRQTFAIRLLLTPATVVLGVVLVSFDAKLSAIALGVALGGILNIWNGVRACDQSREDYRSFNRASVAFMAIRGTFGLIALFWLRDPIAVAVATYALPVAASATSGSFRFVISAFSGAPPPLRKFLGYALYVHINQVAFIAIPYLPQFVIASRLSDQVVGAFGLILTFTGPVSLVVYSLRSVLLPKMLGGRRMVEDFLWSWRGGLVLSAGWFLLTIGGGMLALVLHHVYGAKFPGIGLAFIIFFASLAGTATFGLLSLSVHTRSLPHYGMIVSVAKLFVLLPALLLFGHSLLTVVVWTGAVMLAGEVALIVLLAIREWR